MRAACTARFRCTGSRNGGPTATELEAAITDRTRLILVNSPHNPTGVVFDDEILELIVELATRHDAIIVTDEVYEHLTFGVPHRPIATLPGAWERTDLDLVGRQDLLDHGVEDRLADRAGPLVTPCSRSSSTSRS